MALDESYKDAEKSITNIVRRLNPTWVTQQKELVKYTAESVKNLATIAGISVRTSYLVLWVK